MDPIYRVSGLGRPVDPSYPTNLAILAIASAVLMGVTLEGRSADLGWLEAGSRGLNAAVSVFLAWALTRELAPDDQAGAFLAAILAGGAWVLLGGQSLLIPLVLLLAIRVVNRCTGKAAEVADALLVLPLFGFAAWSESWTLGVAGAAAFALDALLPSAPAQPRRRYHLGLASVLLVVAAVRLGTGTGGIQLPEQPLPLLLVAVLAFAAGVAGPSARSLGDVDGEVLIDSRVRSGLLLGVLATAAVTLDAGVPTGSLGVLWSSLAALVVGLPFLLIRSRGQSRG